MGQVLPRHVTAKESGDADAVPKGLAWGFSSMQGWRVSMEDAHFALGTLQGHGWEDTAAFGVMDGHGGEHVAHFCEHYLPLEIGKGKSSDSSAALADAFLRMDELLDGELRGELHEFARARNEGITGKCGVNPDWTGCTANVCLIRPDCITVANAGDSRSVLCRSGQAVPLSEDHKPNNPEERSRIQRAGGVVERQQIGEIVQYRVNGGLNLSRSIGDLEYKRNGNLPPAQQMISAMPDVATFDREAGDEFVIIACDGVWDVVGNQDAVDFVRQRLGQGRRQLSSIAEELLDHCVSPDLSKTKGLGGDNMTAIIIVFDPPSKLASGMSNNNQSMIYEEKSVDNSTVEDKMISPAGLCGCKIDG